VYKIDAGLAKYTEVDVPMKPDTVGKPAERYWMGMVGLGLGADASVAAEKWRCCGAMRYDVAVVAEICKINKKIKNPTRINMIDKAMWEKNVNTPLDKIKPKSVVKPNGSTVILLQKTIHCGDRIMSAPTAKLDNGYFDVIMAKDKLGKRKTLEMFNKMKDGGKHVDMPEIEYGFAKKFEIEADDQMYINVDGENCGITPLVVESCPEAFEMFIPHDGAGSAALACGTKETKVKKGLFSCCGKN